MRPALALALALLALVVTPGAACAQRARLDDVPGVVISHERSPNPLRYLFGAPRFIGSPSLTILPNGHLVASHDLFTRGGGELADLGVTKVFRSTDGGATWRQVARIEGAFWSTVFAHRGAVYLLGPTRAGGDLVIRRSDDEGATWTEPRDADTGLLRSGRHGGTPCPPVVHAGRLWISGSLPVLSAPVDADLLKASSWTRSRGYRADPTWFGGRFRGWGESQVVASPGEGVVVLPKLRGLPYTALLRYDRPRGRPTFDPATDFVALPGAEKKFGALYDPASDRFYALTNPVLPPDAPDPFGRVKDCDPSRPVCPLAPKPELIRNAAALYSSADLRTWELERVFLYSSDVRHAAFQYLNAVVDGDDLLVVSRTAYHVGFWNTPRGHDSNLMTFHRIEDFRTRPADPYPRELRRRLSGVVHRLPGAR